LQNINNTSFKLRLKGELAAIVIKIAGALPLIIGQRLGAMLGRLMMWANTREVKIARRNLEICFPSLLVDEREELLRSSFINEGMQIFEIAYLWRSSPEHALKLIDEFEGIEIFNEAIDKKQGILLIMPHLGNWELANSYVLHQIKLLAMYTPSQFPAVEKLMREGRERTGLQLAEASTRGVVKLLKTLNDGGNVMILPDQEPDVSGGEFASFFGTQALTMTLLSKMLHKSNATPVLAFVYRKGIGKGFKLLFRSAEPGIHNKDIKISLGSLNRSIEKSIEEFPEQYMWGYKRFRKRPTGEKSLYKKLS